VDVEELCRDLVAERDELLVALAGVGDWRVETPAAGWSLRDQVSHLAAFDEAATMAITQPDQFRGHVADVRRAGLSVTESKRLESYTRADDEVVTWLATAGEELVRAARAADPKVRVPWYGPEMSLASCITARIMETWAHGQDVFDALDLPRAPSPRLHHVAFIGWRAIPNSFHANGLPAPTDPIRVEVGELTLRPADATNRVSGSLVDFCLLVTQRRHLADTDLTAIGPVASKWITIAQAFAGSPGPGRSPR
jgi:uncharacterized protein (TIGR03084 family)